MKVSEYLEKLPIGEVVTNKRLLAALKRKGLIDYSVYGYVCGNVDRVIEYKGNYFTTQYLDGCFNPYLVKCDSKGHYERKRRACNWGVLI